MTDEQILNALKACGDSIAICDGCPDEGRNYCSLLAKQDIIARFEQLKAENAALRERLEKTVELPCKVGDTIYSLDHFDLKIRENKVIAITFLLSNSVNHLEVQAHNFRGAVASFESIDFGKDVFTDRSAAEARLAELEGGEI